MENVLGKDDWHLCEGLLQIFLKGGGTTQTVTFNNNVNKAGERYENRSGAAMQRMIQK